MLFLWTLRPRHIRSKMNIITKLKNRPNLVTELTCIIVSILLMGVVACTVMIILQVRDNVTSYAAKQEHMLELRAKRTLKPEMKEVLIEVDGSVVELQVGVVVVDGVRYQVVSQPRTSKYSSITTLQILPHD